MFKEIHYSHAINDKIIYHLIDDDFVCDIDTLIAHNAVQSGANFTARLIAEYQSRGLPVVNNVVLAYYARFKSGATGIRFALEEEKVIIDQLCPEYSINYYPCIVNQIKTLSFCGRVLF